MLIEFNAEQHAYTVDGAPYPNVTGILKEVYGEMYQHVRQDVLAYKSDIGRAVDRAIDLHAQGMLDSASVVEPVKGYFDGWRLFCEEFQVEVVGAQISVCSKVHGYAGTLDWIAEITPPGMPDDRIRALIDTKCVAQMSRLYALQTAAYEKAYAESHGGKVNLRMALQLKPDGLYRVQYHSNKHDLNNWISTLNVYRIRKENQ